MTDLGAGTLHVSGSSMVAGLLFYLFSWVTLAWAPDGPSWGPGGQPGGQPEGPDVDDDIANTLGQTIAQHHGKYLLRSLFCEEMAGVLSDEMLIGIVIPWDSLIHCWQIGNGRLDDMMEVITLVQDKKVGYSTPWWPEHSSGSNSVRIKGYLIDVAVSCVLRDVHSARLYVMGVTAVAAASTMVYR